MGKPQRFCIFCGKPGRTLEHVWPKWLRKQLGHDPQATNYISRNLIDVVSGTVDHKKYEKERQGDFLTRKVGVACAGCNSGWMSRLEERTKPVLEALIHGRQTVMEPERLRDLAAWIALKTAVNERAQLTATIGENESVAVPPEECRHLMERGEPSERWRIFIYDYRGVNWSRRYFTYHVPLFATERIVDGVPSRTLVAPPMKPNTLTTTMGLGCFIFHSLGAFGAMDPTEPASNHAEIHRIWPLQGKALKWPNHDPIGDDVADRLAVQLYDLLVDSGVRLPPLITS